MGLWSFFFEPTCPVPVEQKRWLEKRMAWLIREFGLAKLRAVNVVTRTEEFFPDRYDATRDAACDIFARVCGFMGVDPARVRLRFFNDEAEFSLKDLNIPYESSHSGAAGLYRGGDQKSEVALSEGKLDQPHALVATIAHELGHVILLGDNHVDRDEKDHEPLTDLATVFFGLGIFNANSAVYFEQTQSLGMHGHKWGRLGYLNMDQFGYAHALFALARKEGKPAWATHLRDDVHHAYKRGIKYISKTGDVDPEFVKAAGL